MSGLELAPRLGTLTVFRSLLRDPVLEALCAYLETRRTGDACRAASAYAGFAARLYEAGGDLGRHIQHLAEEDENVYMRLVGRGETPPPFMEQCVEEELALLQAVAELAPEDLLRGLDWVGFLPGFGHEPTELAADYRRRTENIGRYGYGIYARHSMFYLDAGGRIVPVRHPDRTKLSDLVDYEREKGILLENTRALLAGRPAANVLLTGDAGTGKSSTVKAVVNELYPEGLRILEIRKEQLREIPAILDELTQNPLHFILFIDDLSFQKNDDNYSALKAILEGSVSAKSQNVAVYTTSNRRHLVKENFSERDGDDIHRNDTMQEIFSLSDRFGVHITFQRPDKATYLHIVRRLADACGVSCADLDLLAERFALGRGGRSARAARQFVDGLLAGQAE